MGKYSKIFEKYQALHDKKNEESKKNNIDI